jgi:hypothetical protein
MADVGVAEAVIEVQGSNSRRCFTNRAFFERKTPLAPVLEPRAGEHVGLDVASTVVRMTVWPEKFAVCAVKRRNFR